MNAGSAIGQHLDRALAALHSEVDSEAGAPDRPNWAKPTPAWIAGLPRDPRQLHDRLRADVLAGSPGMPDRLVPSNIFDMASGILESGLVPAELRATFYRMLSDLPGLEITDQAGVKPTG